VYFLSDSLGEQGLVACGLCRGADELGVLGPGSEKPWSYGKELVGSVDGAGDDKHPPPVGYRYALYQVIRCIFGISPPLRVAGRGDENPYFSSGWIFKPLIQSCQEISGRRLRLRRPCHAGAECRADFTQQVLPLDVLSFWNLLGDALFGCEDTVRRQAGDDAQVGATPGELRGKSDA
jgi:hypothetical protein